MFAVGLEGGKRVSVVWATKRKVTRTEAGGSEKRLGGKGVRRGRRDGTASIIINWRPVVSVLAARTQSALV